MAQALPNPNAIPNATPALTAYQQQLNQQNAMLAGLMGTDKTPMPTLPNDLPVSFTGKATPVPTWLDILQARGAQLGGQNQVDPGVTYGGLK
jgi:hypothetical protein